MSVFAYLHLLILSLQAVNQIERHPLNPQPELLAFCKEHNIHITSYSPLGNNVIGAKKIIDYESVKVIADQLGATTAQVLVAWGAFDGCSVIPKSVHEGACSTPALALPVHACALWAHECAQYSC